MGDRRVCRRVVVRWGRLLGRRAKGVMAGTSEVVLFWGGVGVEGVEGVGRAWYMLSLASCLPSVFLFCLLFVFFSYFPLFFFLEGIWALHTHVLLRSTPQVDATISPSDKDGVELSMEALGRAWDRLSCILFLFLSFLSSPLP